MRASRLAKYQSKRDTPTHRHGMGLPLSPHQPFDDSHHAALADQQQQDNGGEHDFYASEPIAGLLPALGTDGLMHGQAGGGFVLAHDLSPVMLLVPAAARGSASVRAVPTATRWAIIPAGKSVRAVSSLNPIVAGSARWRSAFTKRGSGSMRRRSFGWLCNRRIHRPRLRDFISGLERGWRNP